ncbi:MAG: dienelactone hydrolase family protein [Candidatus Hydrogenedentota bacterium]
MHRLLPLLLFFFTCTATFADPLPGTAPLTFDGDPGIEMVEGIHAWLDHAAAASVQNRAQYWDRDLSSPESYEKSIAVNRERFSEYIGMPGGVPPFAPMPPDYTAGPLGNVHFLSAFPGVNVAYSAVGGEAPAPGGLRVIFLGDCDWMAGSGAEWAAHIEAARRLAASGIHVYVPMLINRNDTYSGTPNVRMTNQPHREFIYRAAFNQGEHIIGYEVQKVRTLVDRLEEERDGPIGLVGYGEGGLIALYAAALDSRIDAVMVSGYFKPRDGLHAEPIYRNVWRLLREFGDAEIASMVAPRKLIVEASGHPDVTGPPPEEGGRRGAAPGKITTPDTAEVRREVARARALVDGLTEETWLAFIVPEDGVPFSDTAMQALANALAGAPFELASAESAAPRFMPRKPGSVQETQVKELIAHTQRIMRDCKHTRKEFWTKADDSSAEVFEKSAHWYRKYFHGEVIGKLPASGISMNPRTRLAFDTDAYTGHEVMLDVYAEVFTYGLLLVPKDIGEEEQRPVVVCQHGLEGMPQVLADPRVEHKAYKQFGCRLAEQGYIVYAPQNPYIGGNRFRQIQRKANPLGYTLFSFIVAQHRRHLDWLKSLDFVDPDRIGFYGLSYGGKTAMRVPAILEDYALSICSGDFNEWIWKIASVEKPFSYMFTHEYEMLEWNLGNTFNYAEMSWLVFPRPFMVERGHEDGVSIDEWVAYEYARTRRLYDKLGYSNGTRIEYFNGPHAINGEGTFAFLREFLWEQNE